MKKPHRATLMSFLLQKRLQLLKESLLPFELTHSGWFALPIYPSWHLQTWDVREWPWRFNFPSKQNECAIFPFMCIPHGSLLSYMLWCGHFLQSVGKENKGQTCHTIATQKTTSFPDPLLLGPRWRRRRGPGNEVAFSVVLSHCHCKHLKNRNHEIEKVENPLWLLQ